MITAKVLQDSINSTGNRLTTLELEYPRFIHSELLTHRIFSKNSSSSRAIPISRMISNIENNPVEPMFMMNKKGMAADEPPTITQLKEAQVTWLSAQKEAIASAKRLQETGIHKQIANRLLEPFMHIKVVLSGTSFDNFFNLRINPAAQQEINKLAICIKEAITDSVPWRLYVNDRRYHLPYINQAETHLDIDILKKVSVARCARVSYYNNDGTESDIESDLSLFDRLYSQGHLSPFEHVASAGIGSFANYEGFKSFRWELEDRRRL